MLADEEEEQRPHQPELWETEQLLLSSHHVERKGHQQDILHDELVIPLTTQQSIPTHDPLPDDGSFLRGDGFFGVEVKTEKPVKAKAPKKRKDEGASTDVSDCQDSNEENRKLKQQRNKKQKKSKNHTRLLDPYIELSNDEMRAMLDSGKTSNDDLLRTRLRKVCHIKTTPFCLGTQLVIYAYRG